MIRLFAKFHHDGMAPRPAARAAQAEMVRFKAWEAAHEARFGHAQAPAMALPTPPVSAPRDAAPLGTIEPPTPRVRLT